MSDKGPRLLKRKAPIAVSMDGLFKAVKSIAAHGNEDEFLAAVRQSGATVTVPAELVNAVKQHLHDKGAHLASEHAADIVASAPPKIGEPPTCFSKPPKAIVK